MEAQENKVIDFNELKLQSEMFKDYPDVVTVEELATMLKIGKTKAYELLKNDGIYSKKLRGKYLIPKISVVKYIFS